MSLNNLQHDNDSKEFTSSSQKKIRGSWRQKPWIILFLSAALAAPLFICMNQNSDTPQAIISTDRLSENNTPIKTITSHTAIAPGLPPTDGTKQLTDSLPEKTTKDNPTPSPSLPPGERQQGTVVDVVDGDTIKVKINGITYPVRYIGIDTPEIQHEEWMGEEAYLANKDLVQNQNVYLQSDVSETDRFGRLLRYVYLTDGTFVNAFLVEAGFAKSVRYPPDTQNNDLFDQLQESARQSMLGIWKPRPTSSSTEGRFLDIITVDKSAEFVTIQNTGDQVVNLGDFILRSERGHQDCDLEGILQPGETIQVFARLEDLDQGGYNCQFDNNIWNNSESDPAVLLDLDYQEVDRYPE